MKNYIFKMWHYSVSHNKMLLRSVHDGWNTDICFLDIKYIELPTVLRGITILEPSQTDVEYLSDIIDIKDERITVILSQGKRYYVVSSIVKVIENELDLFELPYE